MRKKYMDELLQSFLQMENGPKGCGLMCAQNNEVTYEGCFGYADVEMGIPLSPKTIFRLMSCTKVIVMTAALLLLERGKYYLDEPLERYFPEYANPHIYVKDPDGYHTIKAERKIRVKDAFTMTCGLPYDIAGTEISQMMLDREKILIDEKGWNYDIVSEVRAMGDVPLMFEPGTSWCYGYGHDIVAALIAITSNMTPYEFMKKEIFDPLGMEDTAYRYKNDEHRARMCTLYAPNEDGVYVPTPGPRDRWHEPDANFDMGAAGLYSTLTDYLTFTQMLANGGKTKDGRTILNKNTIDLMRTNALEGKALADFKATGGYECYGYGLGVRTRVSGIADVTAPVGEFGWAGMCGSWTSIDPDHGFSCIYMHQMLPDMNDYLPNKICNAVYSLIERR